MIQIFLLIREYEVKMRFVEMGTWDLFSRLVPVKLGQLYLRDNNLKNVVIFLIFDSLHDRHH